LFSAAFGVKNHAFVDTKSTFFSINMILQLQIST